MGLIVLRFRSVSFLNVVVGGKCHWSLVETAIFHGRQDFSVVFNQLLESIIAGIKGFWFVLRKSDARGILVNTLLGECCIFILFDWRNLVGLDCIFLLIIVSLKLNSSCYFFLHSRATHLINCIVLIRRFHEFWDGRLDF